MAECGYFDAAPAKPKRVTKPKTDWHLVCETKKGRVSILKNLDYATAVQTYRRLMPDQRPRTYKRCDCNLRGLVSYGYGFIGGTERDCMKEVHAIGPEGAAFEPREGWEPIEEDIRCDKCIRAEWEAPCFTTAAVMPTRWSDLTLPDVPELKPAPQPEPHATPDFWNDPERWDRIENPHKEMFWEKQP